jgi:glycosyltransferase involved in cell wall biosynthesis
MRICYLNYEWDLAASTGAATQIRETVAGLERLGHEVHVVARHRQPPSRLGHSAHRTPNRWLWEPANYLRSATGISAETRMLRRLRPDVVLILHALRFSGLVAARTLGLPVVFQVNASVPFEIRRYRGEMRLLPGVSEWAEGRMLAAADGVTAVSRILSGQLVKLGVSAESIAVIPNGADATRFHPEAADVSLRARHPGRTLAGFAGSFASFHGLEGLERAVVESAVRSPDLHFVFAGPGPGAARLADRLRAQGCESRATFLGRVPYERMPALLAAMDILLAPYPPQSEFYFSPLKLFEYLACGRAVLAARLGQIAEVIDDGENGVLYDPAEPAGFVSKLLQLASDPLLRSRLGAQARRTILARYTWAHNAALLSEVLERARRRAPELGRPRARAASF